MFAILSICVMLFQPMLASAKCGGVDYSWGADALSNAHQVLCFNQTPVCFTFNI